MGTLVNPVQLANDIGPMAEALMGRVKLVKLMHSPNALSPMNVTLSGIVTLVRRLHP
jgi:hypothetical protein